MWVNGQELTQVGSASAVTSGKFYVDDAHNALYPIMSTPGEGGRGDGQRRDGSCQEEVDRTHLRVTIRPRTVGCRGYVSVWRPSTEH